MGIRESKKMGIRGSRLKKVGIRGSGMKKKSDNWEKKWSQIGVGDLTLVQTAPIKLTRPLQVLIVKTLIRLSVTLWRAGL